VGWDSVVGIATCYKLDGPGNTYQWGQDIPHLSRPALRPNILFYNGQPVFPVVKWPRHGVDHPPLPSTKVKE